MRLLKFLSSGFKTAAEKPPKEIATAEQLIKNTEPQLTDRAAIKLFETFGTPEGKMHSSNNFKIWQAEIEIGQARQDIESGKIPTGLAQIIERSISAFDDALMEKKHQDFNSKGNNFYTVGYSYHRMRSRQFGYEQAHILSIGCPFGTEGAPRFEVQLQKDEHTRQATPKNSVTWLWKTTQHSSFTHHAGVPSEFYDIGKSFFDHVLDQYADNEHARDAKSSFAIGGAYGPTGVL